MNEWRACPISASLPHVEERKRLRAVWMLLLATVCWGMSFPLMKGLVLLQQRLLPDANVWFITAQTSTVRFAVAAIVLGLICTRRMRGFTRLDLKLGVGLGFFAGTGTLLQMAALSETLASTSAFLTQFYVLLLPLWVVVWQRRRPSWLLLFCCALVIAGMGVLCGLRWNDWHLGRGEWLTLLAAVLLPNAINPTSAFLQILPLDRVTETNLTMEQAMSMLMTGGAVGPETIRYTQPALAESEIPTPPASVA